MKPLSNYKSSKSFNTNIKEDLIIEREEMFEDWKYTASHINDTKIP